MKKFEKIILAFLIVILSIVYIFFKINNLILLMKLTVLLIYILLILVSYLKNQIITFLFLGALFLFQYGRCILLPLFGYEIEMTWFYYTKFSLETDIFVTNLLFINLIGVCIGNLLPIPQIKMKGKLSFESEKKIIFIFIFLTIAFYFKSSFEIINFLKKISYNDFYKIGVYNINKSNIIEKVCYNIYFFSILFGLSLKNLSKSNKIILILLNIINTFLIALRGTRAIFIAAICFSVWYLIKEKVLKINIKKLFLIGGIIFILIVGLENLRENKKFILNSFSVSKIVERVLYSQGVTGTYLCLLKEEPQIFKKDKIPFIFSSLIGLRLKSQTKEDYDKIMSSQNVVLAEKISASLNKEMYLDGNGMGGNYIIEMYDFGEKIGILFFSAALIVFFNFIDKNYNNFIWIIRAFLLFLIPKLFLIPRCNYFIYFPFLEIIEFLFVYFLITISTKILKKI